MGRCRLRAYFAIKQQALLDLAMPYVDKPILAQIAVGAIAFIITLIIVSLISVKISDSVVDSAAGAFDRTLGFIYGLARGFVLVAIAYLFYGWLLPFDKQEDWVRNASSLPAIKSVGETLLTFMPPDIAETLSNTALMKNPDAPAGTTTQPAPVPATPEAGYQSGETQRLDNLIEGTGNTTQNPNSDKHRPMTEDFNINGDRLREECVFSVYGTLCGSADGSGPSRPSAPRPGSRRHRHL